jgi:hypothetical protein
MLVRVANVIARDFWRMLRSVALNVAEIAVFGYAIDERKIGGFFLIV